jgi:hypothetical protein
MYIPSWSPSKAMKDGIEYIRRWMKRSEGMAVKDKSSA